MHTPIEILFSEFLLKDYSNLNEVDINNEIDVLLVSYPKKSVVTILNDTYITMRTPDTDRLVNCNLLHIAAYNGEINVLRKLLDLGVNVERMTTSFDEKYNQLYACQFAKKNNAHKSINLLLPYHKEWAAISQLFDYSNEIDDLLQDTRLAFLDIPCGPKKIIDYLLLIADNKHLLESVYSAKSKQNKNLLNIFASLGDIDSLQKMMSINNWHYYADFIALVHDVRCAVFKFPEKSREFNAICADLKSHPFYEKVKRHPIKLSTEIYQIRNFSDKYQELFLTPFNYESSKEISLKRMIAQAYVLLDSPILCIKYLKFFNEELKRYYKDMHGKYVPSFRTGKYEVHIMDGLAYPIPNQNYMTFSNYNTLDKLLISILKVYGLASKAVSCHGDIPASKMIQMVTEGYYFKENIFRGLWQGKFSHMLQTVILIYAIQNKEINLDYMEKEEKKSATVKEFLAAFMQIKQMSTPDFVWERVHNNRKSLEVSFADPHRLFSFILMQGRDFELHALFYYLINSFCKDYQKVVKGYQTVFPSLGMDRNTFLQHMSDLDIRDFSTPESLFLYGVKETETKVTHALRPEVIINRDFAIFPLKYTNEKSSFLPRKFTDPSQAHLLIVSARTGDVDTAKILGNNPFGLFASNKVNLSDQKEDLSLQKIENTSTSINRRHS